MQPVWGKVKQTDIHTNIILWSTLAGIWPIEIEVCKLYDWFQPQWKYCKNLKPFGNMDCHSKTNPNYHSVSDITRDDNRDTPSLTKDPSARWKTYPVIPAILLCLVGFIAVSIVFRSKAMVVLSIHYSAEHVLEEWISLEETYGLKPICNWEYCNDSYNVIHIPKIPKIIQSCITCLTPIMPYHKSDSW